MKSVRKSVDTSLHSVRQFKNEKNGRFEERFYVHYVDIQEDHSKINYYLNSPHKYPEIKFEETK
jgi:hypothetical protein